MNKRLIESAIIGFGVVGMIGVAAVLMIWLSKEVSVAAGNVILMVVVGSLLTLLVYTTKEDNV